MTMQTTSNQIKITGFVMSRNGITVFTSDGQSEVMSQGEWRTAEIVKRIAAEIGEKGFALIDKAAYSVEAKLAGAPPSDVKIEMAADAATATAIVGDKRIDLGTSMKKHIEEAVYGDGMRGLENFMRKFAEHKCPQSSKELLQFMERTDLPIADDGAIVAYKILYAHKKDGETVYVDPHTKLVKQKVGSLVEVPPEILDPSKRNLCSTGLHVCYRDYVGGFDGDTLALIKIQPEDCIAVAANDHKMRVAKYHICAILPNKAYAKIKEKASARDEDGYKTLLDVVNGIHPPVLERVIIRGRNGTNIEVIPVEGAAQVATGKRKVIKKDKTPTVAEVKATVMAAKKKAGKKLSKTEERLADFYARMKTALERIKIGKESQRTVAKELKLDRETLGHYVRGEKALPLAST